MFVDCGQVTPVGLESLADLPIVYTPTSYLIILQGIIMINYVSTIGI